MGFFESLRAEAAQAWTGWVVAVTAVSFVVARLVAFDRPRFRAVVSALALHLLGLVTVAALVASGSALADSVRPPTWVCGAVALVGATGTLLFSALLPRLRLPTPPIMQDVLVALAMAAAALTVLSRSGVNLSGLIATSAVFTAVLGFSLQDMVGNVAGGLALQVDNAVEEGDWIRVGDVTGRVREIRWRHTAVETNDWTTVLLPNSLLMKSTVTVLGRRAGKPPQARRWVYFHVDWRTQPGDVQEVVEKAVGAAEIPHVARDPAPSAVLMDMADTYGRYAVRYWLTDLASDDATDSAVRACVYFALQRAGIRPALPAQAVFVTEETEARKATHSARERRRRELLLERITLFSVLSTEERTALAEHLRYSPFSRGEVMTRQGAEAHWLYLVEEGAATVRVSDGQQEREVARLEGPTVFGEMSLLTGEPRAATVVAVGEVECFRLDRASVQPLLEARPDLAAQLATLLSQRGMALAAAREGLDAEAARARVQHDASALQARIKAFFSLR